MLKRSLNVLLAGGLVLSAATACQGSSAQKSSSGANSSGSGTVVIGYENNGSVDPAQAALSLGFYKKYIKAKIKMVYFASGPAALTALGAGSVDIMTGIGNPPVASALANKVPLSVIWAEELSQTDQALVVRKAKGISSIGQLKGKQIATVVGSTASYALSGVLEKSGLTTSDVTLRNLDPQAIGNAWKTGQIDAAYIWYPVLGQLLQNGGAELATDTDVEQKLPIYNLSVTNKNWASQNTARVQEFIEAQSAGVEAMRTSLTPSLTRMIKDTGESLADAQVAAGSTKWFTAAQQLSPDALGSTDGQSLVATSLIAASKYLHSLDPSLTELTSAGGAVDRTFVTAVAKRAGGS